MALVKRRKRDLEEGGLPGQLGQGGVEKHLGFERRDLEARQEEEERGRE